MRLLCFYFCRRQKGRDDVANCDSRPAVQKVETCATSSVSPSPPATTQMDTFNVWASLSLNLSLIGDEHCNTRTDYTLNICCCFVTIFHGLRRKTNAPRRVFTARHKFHCWRAPRLVLSMTTRDSEGRGRMESSAFPLPIRSLRGRKIHRTHIVFSGDAQAYHP